MTGPIPTDPLEPVLAEAKMRSGHGMEAPLSGKAGLRSAEEVIGLITFNGSSLPLKRIRLKGPATAFEPVRLGLFSGLHGDEPAGPAALEAFADGLAANPGRGAGYDIWIYPAVNPVGLLLCTRENAAGKDLNREFWKNSQEPEVLLIEHELRANRFNGLITLHADDTCQGPYGYSHGRAMEDSLLRPALVAAERFMPRDPRHTIDGFSAREGVIADCFQGILAPPPDQRPKPFNLIFETPASAPLETQVAAHIAALEAIIDTYRSYLAYAQDI